MRRLGLLLSMLPLIAAAQGEWEWEPTDYPPMYYKETPFGYEKLDSLPVVTLRDTVYIADIDAFLESYIADGTNINVLIKDINSLRSLLDSLDVMRGERLYYNHFLPADTLHSMSEGFVVRELNVDDSLALHTSVHREPSGFPMRREILFRIDGSYRTTRFIHDKAAMRRAISRLFTEIRNDSAGIRGIDLFFPDYDFTNQRDMVQFVKSVRIMMDASRDFKFGGTPMHVFFRAPPEYEAKYREFVYSLEQEATSVVFLDGVSEGGRYLRAREFTASARDNMGLPGKIRSHLMIARYYTGPLDIRNLQITDFSETDIREILEADYPENDWEVFVFLLCAILLLLAGFVVLYRSNAAVSRLVGSHTESVLLVLTVVVLEIGISLVMAFQNMCGDDRFTIMQRHPVVIFLLPLVVILAAPLLHNILKNRKTP